eukprot:CAMPEP_0113644700 /NCGR_PEP_ID=MMETSP0017_2-20120614/23531_1 /TAXON_ID=2856 /ORGANISM="Cylindrotheca closterium" /LENGTH=482 /DNA_ID=CAMNT_0000556335 /DNA_START=26 /DNA_END=1474 /DNA_ORIENTATION=+ /assembly_acc=CAM_ASM_000147
MIYVKFSDEGRRNLNHLVEGSSALPDGVSGIAIRDSATNWNDPIPLECDALTQMLEQSPNKIKRVSLNHRENVSPEYLALLTSLFKKADILEFHTFEGDAAYTCLMACLMQSNGPRELRYWEESISPYQANLFFRGIAFSTSVETLDLSFTEGYDVPQNVGRALADSLGRNRSLKKLKLVMGILELDVEGILRTAILETQVQSLQVLGQDHSEDFEIPFNILRDVLCREDCALERFRLACGVGPSSRAVAMNDDELSTTLLTNSSVKGVCLDFEFLDFSRIMETIGLFQSIEILCFDCTEISDLSPLDPLLIGSNATLKSLVVQTNDIEETAVINFFGKLPEMKRLRHFKFVARPFIIGNNDSWKTTAIAAIRRNKSLECVEGGRFGENFIDETKVALSLNRGGRRALEVESLEAESSSVLPAKLWPRVLERATNIVYCDYADTDEAVGLPWDGEESLPILSTRVDVVFWLLQEKMVGQCFV